MTIAAVSSTQAPTPTTVTASTVTTAPFDLGAGSNASRMAAISASGGVNNDGTKVSLSNAAMAQQALEKKPISVEQATFKPWIGKVGDLDEMPSWVDFFGMSFPPIAPANDRAAQIASLKAYDAFRELQASFSYLSDEEQQYLTKEVMKHYHDVLEANKLSSDNPKSRELLIENKTTSEQYHQQYKQRVDADPKLLAILIKLGLRTAKAG